MGISEKLKAITVRSFLLKNHGQIKRLDNQRVVTLHSLVT